jgi:hypothetical protein
VKKKETFLVELRYSGTSDVPVKSIEGFGHDWREMFLVHIRESLQLMTRNTRMLLRFATNSFFAHCSPQTYWPSRDSNSILRCFKKYTPKSSPMWRVAFRVKVWMTATPLNRASNERS